MQMEALHKTRVDDAVYSRLLANIRDNIWKDGEKLPSENELCRQLGVSRVSVRSAIQRLRAIGLVETKHGIGTYVTRTETADLSGFEPVLDLTEKEFNEINELREAIESKALQLITAQRGKVDLTPVKNAYAAMRAALRARDAQEYNKQDYLFHMAIIHASGNEMFIQITNIFRAQYYKYFQEMNKFIFETSSMSDELLQWCESEYDSHALLYNYLMGNMTDNVYDLMRAFTSGNKKRFDTYLSSRKEGRV